MICELYEAYLVPVQYIYMHQIHVSWITLNMPLSTHPAHQSGWTVMLMLIIDINRWRWGSEREHKRPALTPLTVTYSAIFLCLGSQPDPPEPSAPKTSPLETSSGHKTTYYFYPIQNNSWESHKMSDNAKEGAEKKGITVSQGSDICNHIRKLELMAS